MKFTTQCMILPYVAFFFFYKVEYLYCFSLQQHMRSSIDLSSRPGIFALLRSQTLISTSSCFLRRQEEEVGADPSAVTWRRSWSAWQGCSLPDRQPGAGTSVCLSKGTSVLGVLHIVPCFCRPGDRSLSCPCTVPWGRPTGSFGSRIPRSYPWRPLRQHRKRGGAQVVADTFQLTRSHCHHRG